VNMKIWSYVNPPWHQTKEQPAELAAD
jgi:hypothetical protein